MKFGMLVIGPGENHRPIDELAQTKNWFFFGHHTARAHVHTPFSYLGNGWADGAETWCVARGPLSMRFTRDGRYPHERTCSCTHFKHICSLLLVHRPKGVLLVIKWDSHLARIWPGGGSYQRPKVCIVRPPKMEIHWPLSMFKMGPNSTQKMRFMGPASASF